MTTATLYRVDVWKPHTMNWDIGTHPYDTLDAAHEAMYHKGLRYRVVSIQHCVLGEWESHEGTPGGRFQISHPPKPPYPVGDLVHIKPHEPIPTNAPMNAALCVCNRPWFGVPPPCPLHGYAKSVTCSNKTG